MMFHSETNGDIIAQCLIIGAPYLQQLCVIGSTRDWWEIVWLPENFSL